MRKMMNKVAGNMKVTVAKAAMLLKDKKGDDVYRVHFFRWTDPRRTQVS